MLPNLRAVIAAVAGAVALLAVAFGVVATFRVAQEQRTGVLQANLVERARGPAPASDAPRPIPIIEAPPPSPAKHDYADALEPVPVTPVVAAAALVEPVPVMPVIAAAPLAAPAPIPEPQAPPAEPPIGGPLPEQIAAVHPEIPAHSLAAERAAKKAAAQKAAAKARAARIARERKTAARRAAQARRAQQNAANNTSGDSFNSFGRSAFGNDSFGTFGTTPPRNALRR